MMAGKQMKITKKYILKEAAKIFSSRHLMTVEFLSENYCIDETDFILSVLTFSLLLDDGHIRISLENIDDELEKYFLLNIRQATPLTDLLLKNSRKIKTSLKKYPDIFKDPSSLFRAPFILLDSGNTVTSEKLFSLEKSAVDLIRNFIRLSSDNNRYLSLADAEETAAEVEQKSGIVFEKKQKEAVVKSLVLPFLILTGGPGTGKTTTIISIVRGLIEQGKKEGRKLRIAVCAPTGRAANRIEEMVENEGLSEFVEQPQTMHRLLRISSSVNRFEKGIYLPYDVVIADESSMIDLRMMKALFEALSPETSLIMSGDADQLPSVEAGAVFSDILADADDEDHILHNNIVRLDKMKRSGSDIADLALKIRENNFTFNDIKGNSSFITVKPLEEKTLYQDLLSLYMKNTDNRESVFDIIENNGVLTTTNRGPFGMDSINRKIREASGFRNIPYYENMPVMVLKNDYTNMVFNGDRGVIVRKDDIFCAVFKTGTGEHRYIPVTLLNDWTVSYAQTVHKSQGSEFENVYIILDSFSERILTREILYTAVTRAKKKIIIYSDEGTLETAVSRNVYRNSGIRDAVKRKL